MEMTEQFGFALTMFLAVWSTLVLRALIGFSWDSSISKGPQGVPMDLKES